MDATVGMSCRSYMKYKYMCLAGESHNFQPVCEGLWNVLLHSIACVWRIVGRLIA